MSTPVYLEVGKQRVFACSLEWPGWCRSARREEAALATLAEYAPRYTAVTRSAGVPFPRNAAGSLRVVERLPGTATTDFGAPGEIPAGDSQPLDRAGAERLVALVRASWTLLDGVSATAPAELRRGPRGGGRDRDKVLEHVLAAEAAYARKLGVKHPQPRLGDLAAIASMHEAILATMLLPSDGSPPVARAWPIRYAARRIAWHVLDHAWEIEDRSGAAT